MDNESLFLNGNVVFVSLPQDVKTRQTNTFLIPEMLTFVIEGVYYNHNLKTHWAFIFY